MLLLFSTILYSTGWQCVESPFSHSCCVADLHFSPLVMSSVQRTCCRLLLASIHPSVIFLYTCFASYHIILISHL